MIINIIHYFGENYLYLHFMTHMRNTTREIAKICQNPVKWIGQTVTKCLKAKIHLNLGQQQLLPKKSRKRKTIKIRISPRKVRNKIPLTNKTLKQATYYQVCFPTQNLHIILKNSKKLQILIAKSMNKTQFSIQYQF